MWQMAMGVPRAAAAAWLRDTQQWPRNGSAVLFDVLRVDLHTIVSCSFILFYDHGFRGHSKITDILYASVFGSFGDIYPGQKDTKRVLKLAVM